MTSAGLIETRIDPPLAPGWKPGGVSAVSVSPSITFDGRVALVTGPVGLGRVYALERGGVARGSWSTTSAQPQPSSRR